MSKVKFFSKKIFTRFLLIIITILVIVIVFASFLTFLPTRNLEPLEIDRISYQEASARTVDIQNQEIENDLISDKCQTDVVNTGLKTERVVDILHGVTNCPAQYSELKNDIADEGYNVYIPRLFGHGYKDKETKDIADISSKILENELKNILEIASGLGDKVTVVGISGSANIAAFASFNVDFVDKAVLLSPLFMPLEYPLFSQNFVIHTLNILPNTFQWWDSEVKENLEGPDYAYPRFPTRSIPAFLDFSADIKRSYENNESPASRVEMDIIYSPLDEAINQEVVDIYADNLRSLEKVGVKVDKLPENWGLTHDLVDPNNPDQNTGLIYPEIVDAVDN